MWKFKQRAECVAINYSCSGVKLCSGESDLFLKLDF